MRIREQLEKSVSSWRRRLPAPEGIGPTAVVSGTEIQNIQPLNGRTITKALQISAVGYVSGQKVKIYSMASVDQVRLRLSLSELPGQLYLPPIIAAENNIVVESWIDGVSATLISQRDLKLLYEKLLEYMVRRSMTHREFHMSESETSFDYLEYLRARVTPWKFISSIRGFVDKWELHRAQNEKHLVRALSHPDLSLANIVISKGSRIVYVVDNELLHIGRGGFLDFNNSALKGLFVNPQQYDESFQQFHDLTWNLRLLGSALIDGNLIKAEEITTCSEC